MEATHTTSVAFWPAWHALQSSAVSCVFCTDVTAAGEVLSEDRQTWVVLHPQGQVMVVAKRHAENASDLDEGEWLHLTSVWHRAERDLREKTGSDRVIVMKLGIQTPHLHLHLYPFASSATREEVFDVIDGRAELALRYPRPTD
jgi:diadenosine tetraphosphate (Ap4A) HIT family hydrolase